MSALDVSTRAVAPNLFQRLSREAGIAMVFISHGALRWISSSSEVALTDSARALTLL